MIAARLLSAISRRALSMRARRSSVVIGVAWLRIDVRAVMLGGKGPLSAAAPRSPLWAESRVKESPDPPTVDSQRNARRENIQPPGVVRGLCRVDTLRQRDLEHVFEGLDRHERHVVLHFRRQLGEIRF